MSLLAQPSRSDVESTAAKLGRRISPVERLPHAEFVLKRGPYLERPDIASVELVRGCAQQCVFCPSRPESDSRFGGAIYLYDGLPQRLAVEIAARTDKPKAVLVGPSSDPFQPIPEVIAETLAIIRVLARHRINGWLTTRSSIPPNAIDALAEVRDHVRLTVAITSADPALQLVIEPNSASVDDRLHLVTQLRFNEIPVEVSIDPLLPTVTDGKEQLRALLESLAERGVTRVSTSYLVLRPGVREHLERECARQSWLEPLLAAYQNGPMLRDGRQVSQFLPKSRRQRGYALLMSMAANLGISVRLNGLDNPDFQTARSMQHMTPRTQSLQQTFRDSTRHNAVRA